jgi:superfamily I DNA/RNA helicase
LPWGAQPAEEERRLFYVGVTRAQQSLVISYYGVPSPFLAEAGL